mmetsp:Transcript_12057/g.25398  ORF Transcript_12057/g.25398 Transcript_12057/m.25398 type:complete len:255 (-) Transcript_12057:218-982(-)
MPEKLTGVSSHLLPELTAGVAIPDATTGVAATLDETTGVSSHRFRLLEVPVFSLTSSSHLLFTVEATDSLSEIIAESTFSFVDGGSEVVSHRRLRRLFVEAVRCSAGFGLSFGWAILFAAAAVPPPSSAISFFSSRINSSRSFSILACIIDSLNDRPSSLSTRLFRRFWYSLSRSLIRVLTKPEPPSAFANGSSSTFCAAAEALLVTANVLGWLLSLPSSRCSIFSLAFKLSPLSSIRSSSSVGSAETYSESLS